MYYIRKTPAGWYICNNYTKVTKTLNPEEINLILGEFPHLKDSKTVTYFRNRVNSIQDLP